MMQLVTVKMRLTESLNVAYNENDELFFVYDRRMIQFPFPCDTYMSTDETDEVIEKKFIMQTAWDQLFNVYITHKVLADLKDQVPFDFDMIAELEKFVSSESDWDPNTHGPNSFGYHLNHILFKRFHTLGNI